LEKIEEEEVMLGSDAVIAELKTEENLEDDAPEKTQPAAGINSNSRIHPMPGYSNTENLWEKITNLERTEMPPNKHSNHFSEFVITVNERQLKLKRNLLFKKVLKEVVE
jgi:hypothetical protein